MEILCKFFPDFQTWNRIFFWFCKKNPTFSKIAHIYSLWTLFEPILSEKKNLFVFTSLSLSLHSEDVVGSPYPRKAWVTCSESKLESIQNTNRQEFLTPFGLGFPFVKYFLSNFRQEFPINWSLTSSSKFTTEFPLKWVRVQFTKEFPYKLISDLQQ